MELLDGLFQTVPANEPHGIERAAILVMAQTVDRHDPRMLQSAGHFGLTDEALPLRIVPQMTRLDFLERDLAMQFLIKREKDLADPTLRVRTQHAEPGRTGLGPATGGAGLIICFRHIPGQPPYRETFGNVHVMHPMPIERPVAESIERCQTGRGVIVMPPHMLIDERFQQLTTRRGQVATFDQDLSERLVLLRRPVPQRLNQRISADEIHLQRHNAKQQVAIRTAGHVAGLRAMELRWLDRFRPFRWLAARSLQCLVNGKQSLE